MIDLLSVYFIQKESLNSLSEHLVVSWEVQEEVTEPVELTASKIPLQASIKARDYISIQNSIAPRLEANQSYCAKFVSHLFYLKNGIFIYGDAWTMQTAPENIKYLSLTWKASKEYKLNAFEQSNKIIRFNNFKKLYTVLDKEKYPEGVLGFLYHFSGYKEKINEHQLKQTHVVYLSGKDNFLITNQETENRSVEDLLTQKYGYLSNDDKTFITSRGINLKTILKPTKSYEYHDYLVEEQFKIIIQRSLLEIFLQKHENNKYDWLLAPVSYSRLSNDLIREKENQQQIWAQIGGVTWLNKDEYEYFWRINTTQKDSWEVFLDTYFLPEFIKHAILLPVPQNIAEFNKY